MEPQKPGNSPGSGPQVIDRQRVAKERAAQRVRSCTVQNAMRGVLGRMIACAARRKGLFSSKQYSAGYATRLLDTKASGFYFFVTKFFMLFC